MGILHGIPKVRYVPLYNGAILQCLGKGEECTCSYFVRQLLLNCGYIDCFCASSAH